MTPARFAISAVFFVNGFVLAHWVARIPAIAGGLGLGEGQVGVVLLGMAVGALIAFPVAGRLVASFGSSRVTVAFGLAYALAMPLLALAPSLPLLFLGLVLFGAANGGMDVAMNVQGVEVGRGSGRPVMGSLHGFFSLGGFAGAALGGVVAGFGLAPMAHFALVAVVSLVCVLSVARFLMADAPRGEEEKEEGAPAFALPPRALWGLGAVAFCAAVGEGAMADWSALYLSGSLGTGAGTAALGYAVFSLAMLAGRFAADFLVARFGPAAMARAGGLVAALGLALGLLLNTPLAAVAGFGAVGLGLSVVAPLVYGAAGNHPSVPRGPAVAAVATMGYSGFLAGPPALGFVAEASSLRLALAAVVVLGAAIVPLSGAVRRKPRAKAAKRPGRPSPGSGRRRREDPTGQ